jgi:two-component system, NtrC family, response regulator AtoC
MMVGGPVSDGRGVAPLASTSVSEGGSAHARERIVLVIGEGRVETYRLPDAACLTIGRDPDCEVPLAHPRISRRHAVIHAGPPLEIEDLGSTNGIRFAGERLATGRHPLPFGACVQLGPFVAAVLDRVSASGQRGGQEARAIEVGDPTLGGVPEIAVRIAQSAATVLIVGETGTGKDVLARTLHQLSGRQGQLVAVNCAALSETLLESELFGHERGAFTGATAAKPGLFEVAHGGTVFLDEIGELPVALQAKLLRVIEAREVYRLGSTAPTKLDVRFVSATHRDLAAEVDAGRFRQDFWFRINGISLMVPPLRERRAAIPGLAVHFLCEAARAQGRPPPRLSSAALAVLTRHDWPGNVRELRTVMERAVVIGAADELGAADILLDRVAAAPRAEPRDEMPDRRSRLLAAVITHRGNVTSIAQALGTSRSQVRRLARRLGIDIDRYR